MALGTDLPLGDPDRLAEAFADERRRLVLTRVRWVARIAFVPILAAGALNVAVLDAPELAPHLATLAVQAGICLLALAGVHGEHAARRAIGVAMALTMGMGTSLFWSLSLAANDLDVLVGPIGCILMGSTLAFPWGIRPQLAVSIYTAVGYLVIPPWPALDAFRQMNVWLSLGLGLATSVVGAWMLDRQRYATFVERERVGALAREGELLVSVGRDLNATLELPQLVGRITEHGHALVGCDGAALTLIEEARGIARTAAIAPAALRPVESLVGLEFPLEQVAPLLRYLAARGTVEVPDDPALAAAHEVNRSCGWSRTLYVAIQREGRLLGTLAFLQRAAAPAFTAHQLRLAEGVAHQAAIALDNARLVGDLQDASRVKSEFVSTMSHELRTPLHVIMGYTDLLDDLPADERGRAITRIRRASRELLDLIEATLNLGRMEARQDTPTLEPLPLRELWDELAAEFAALPRPSGMALRWAPVEDAHLVTDRRKLKIILKNLVGNALKFTPAGEVTVRCDPDPSRCRFTVHDTGVGIAAEDLPVIFEMFRQADSSDSRSYGGTGLGLYIVRRLVEQLGGEIAVESTPGAGSTFTVSLPREREAA